MRLDFCVMCGARFGLEHHHVTPRSLGGSDDETNFVTLCVPCHGVWHGVKKMAKAGFLISNGKSKAIGRKIESVTEAEVVPITAPCRISGPMFSNPIEIKDDEDVIEFYRIEAKLNAIESALCADGWESIETELSCSLLLLRGRWGIKVYVYEYAAPYDISAVIYYSEDGEQRMMYEYDILA